MPKLVRSSFSMEEPLYEAFEKRVKRRGYENRSEYIRDLFRRDLVGEEWDDDRICLGTITLLELVECIEHEDHAVLLGNQLQEVSPCADKRGDLIGNRKLFLDPLLFGYLAGACHPRQADLLLCLE